MTVMDRKISYAISTALLALLVTGCATPEPKKIDAANIPVQRSAAPVTAGSLWPGETSRNTLFQDLRARNIGDIVTVEVVEKTSAIKEASTTTGRKSTNDVGIQKLLGLPLNFGMRDFLGQGAPFSPEFKTSYDSSFDGSGTTKRTGQLTATIATRVVQVLANGNLVLEGKKDTVVNNELQYIVVSGIARPEDISDTNTVPSTLLSDARIEYSGRGTLSDEQGKGWLGRIFDNVWPF